MKTKLTTTLLALVTVAGVDLATAGDLKTTPPKNVNLTAIWQINPKLSDDPRDVLSGKQDESRSRVPVPPSRKSGGTKAGPFDVDVGDVFGNGTMSGGVTVGRGARRGGSDDSDRPDEDPEPNMKVPLDSFMATREQFEIQQQPEAFTVRTVDETNTCKPGEPSKVPLQSGELVDQRCGWDGSAFVVEVKSPDGVTRTNRYQTQDGGKRLIMVSEIKGGRGKLRGLHIRRVYDRLY